MTYREAVSQAKRESGTSEEEIQEALAFADRQHPAGIAFTHQEIPAGMERQVIDELKRVYALPQETIFALYERSRRRCEKQSENN